MTHKYLSHQGLAALVAELLSAGTRVIAPVRAKDDAGQIDYQLIASYEEAALGVRLPRRSLKEFFLPPTFGTLRTTNKMRDLPELSLIQVGGPHSHH